MARGLGEAADALDEFVEPERTGFGDGPAGNQLSQKRRTGHGGHTAPGAEARRDDNTILNLQRQLKDVATGGVLEAGASIGVGEQAGVARILKMIE